MHDVHCCLLMTNRFWQPQVERKFCSKDFVLIKDTEREEIRIFLFLSTLPFPSPQVMLCYTLLSISSEPRGMEKILLASMENFYVTISALPPIPIYSHCQDPFWAGFFQSTPY